MGKKRGSFSADKRRRERDKARKKREKAERKQLRKDDKSADEGVVIEYDEQGFPIEPEASDDAEDEDETSGGDDRLP